MEGDRRARRARLLGIALEHGQPAEDLVRAPGECLQEPARLALVGGLSEHAAVEEHLRVGAQHEAVAAHPPPGGTRLCERVPDHELGGLPRRLLLDVGRADLEVDAEVGEDRAALGGCRC